MNVFLFIVSCYGITAILTQGRIFNAIRPKGHFWCCPQCVGFHVGYLLYTLFWLSGIHLFPLFIPGVIVFGAVGSAGSYALCNLVKEKP